MIRRISDESYSFLRLAVIEAYRSGERPSSLARRLGVHRNTIWNWTRGHALSIPRGVRDAVVREAREAYARGEPPVAIRQRLAVDRRNFWHWVSGKTRLAAGGPIRERAPS